MKKPAKFVVANWKMNPDSLERAKTIFLHTRRATEGIRKTEVIICPPFVYLESLGRLTRGISLGAQDVFWEPEGSFTGEISASMIKDTGVSYVIIGHSERRALGDTNEIVNKKVKASLKEGLTVILCVGERERDSQGHYLSFLTSQIQSALDKVSKRNLESLIIAYEPVWAVGQSDYRALDGRALHETSLFIRKILADMYGHSEAMETPILYGGSVNTQNAESILSEGNVQGVLVGRQSLEENFEEIIDLVEELL